MRFRRNCTSTNELLSAVHDTKLAGVRLMFGVVTATLAAIAHPVLVHAQTHGSAQRRVLAIAVRSTDGHYYSIGDSSGHGDFEDGVRMGIAEAEQTGALVGWSVQLVRRANVVILQIPVRESPERAELMMIIDGTGAAGCNEREFYITSSRQSLNSLWDSTAEKFGAAQLNDRFRVRFDRAMTSEAWAGWFAVKVLSESAFRAGSAAPNQIKKYLLGPGTKFDGHKGMALTFDHTTHVLGTGQPPAHSVKCK